MPKDRNKAINPAAAQLKADKAKALKKGIFLFIASSHFLRRLR